MKILCCCSAGRNRSKYLAEFLHEKRHETDFAGVHPLSMNKITQARIDWADVLIAVTPWIADAFKQYDTTGKKIITLDFPNEPHLYPDMARAALEQLQ